MKNINEHNRVISEMTSQIDTLLDEGIIGSAISLGSYFMPGSFFTKWALRRALSDDDDNKKIEDDDKDLLDDLKDKLEDKLEGEGIDEIDDEKFDELVSDLNKLLDKQIEIFNKLDKNILGSVRISFGDPVPFTLIKGRDKGKKMKLEGTKDYKVYKVEKTKKGKYKVYFLYEDWLREYDIMFSFEVKSLTQRKKQDNITINLAYIDSLRRKDKGENVMKDIDEKVLTHKAKVEIQDKE